MLTRRLDPNGVIPLYHQLKEIIVDAIDAGEWNPRDMIPSEHQLADLYSVSRNTVKKALETLVQEGVLYRVQGKGTFVASPKLEQSLSAFYSFSQVMKERGLRSRDVVLEVSRRVASVSVAKRLQVTAGSEVQELKRLRFMEDDPFVLETSYLPADMVPDLSAHALEHSSLYDFLRDAYGIIVVKAKESFEPVLISDFEAAYLETHEGYPALLLHRVAFDNSGSVVEYCKSIVRGDKCRFYTELL
ncbi:MAG: GntR family transcriptional regulator [Alicyclobacillus sp.]|nr:GntR family transcriptional regulator [Alicyclobacillus sp.]